MLRAISPLLGSTVCTLTGVGGFGASVGAGPQPHKIANAMHAEMQEGSEIHFLWCVSRISWFLL
jgi:hypothetical protein